MPRSACPAHGLADVLAGTPVGDGNHGEGVVLEDPHGRVGDEERIAGSQRPLLEDQHFDLPVHAAIGCHLSIEYAVSALHHVDIDTAEDRDLQVDGGSWMSVTIGIQNARIPCAARDLSECGVEAESVRSGIGAEAPPAVDRLLGQPRS